MIDWRMGLYLGVLAVLGVFGWRSLVWRDGYLERGAAVKAQHDAEKQRDDAIAGQRKAVADRDAVSQRYQRELETIRTRPVPTTAVRLCKPRVVMPGTTPAKSGPDGPRGAVRMVSDGVGTDLDEGPDIRADLNALMQRCETRAAQARGLQDWARTAAPHDGQ